MIDTLVWKIPIRTLSEANCSEHWTKKNKRHQQQKSMICLQFLTAKFDMKPPMQITLIRISPRFLDKEENLPMAFKWIKDAIADYIFPGQQAGRADDSKELIWKYEQQKGEPKEYAIIVRFEKVVANSLMS